MSIYGELQRGGIFPGSTGLIEDKNRESDVISGPEDSFPMLTLKSSKQFGVTTYIWLFRWWHFLACNQSCRQPAFHNGPSFECSKIQSMPAQPVLHSRYIDHPLAEHGQI